MGQTTIGEGLFRSGLSARKFGAPEVRDMPRGDGAGYGFRQLAHFADTGGRPRLDRHWAKERLLLGPGPRQKGRGRVEEPAWSGCKGRSNNSVGLCCR